jgi:glyoxylase-like metal-dependent hydrolase (beta-lactamase superfamily II)
MTLRLERYDDVTRLRMSSVGSRAVGMDVSAYVVRGIMVDCGFHRVRSELLAALESLGVRGVIVTHWHEDHAGNVPLLAARGMPIVMRDDTDATLRARPDIQLYRRVVWGHPPVLQLPIEKFNTGSLIGVHAPGHSTDHQIVWDADTRTIFSGDLWLGVRARILHASEDPYQIVQSLRVARELNPARMFDAHRGPVDNPVDAITAKIDWLSETIGVIESRIAAGDDDRAIVREVLGGEENAAIVSRGDYSRRNLVKAVRTRLSG